MPRKEPVPNLRATSLARTTEAAAMPSGSQSKNKRKGRPPKKNAAAPSKSTKQTKNSSAVPNSGFVPQTPLVRCLGSPHFFLNLITVLDSTCEEQFQTWDHRFVESSGEDEHIVPDGKRVFQKNHEACWTHEDCPLASIPSGTLRFWDNKYGRSRITKDIAGCIEILPRCSDSDQIFYEFFDPRQPLSGIFGGLRQFNVTLHGFCRLVRAAAVINDWNMELKFLESLTGVVQSLPKRAKPGVPPHTGIMIPVPMARFAPPPIDRQSDEEPDSPSSSSSSSSDESDGEDNEEDSQEIGNNNKGKQADVDREIAGWYEEGQGQDEEQEAESEQAAPNSPPAELKSAAGRLVWTDQLQEPFLRAIADSGNKCTASFIWRRMRKTFPWLTLQQVASHLQNHRNSLKRRQRHSQGSKPASSGDEGNMDDGDQGDEEEEEEDAGEEGEEEDENEEMGQNDAEEPEPAETSATAGEEPWQGDEDPIDSVMNICSVAPAVAATPTPEDQTPTDNCLAE